MDFQAEHILISLGDSDIQIRYYGIIIVTAMLLAASVAARLAKRRGYDPDHVWGALTWAIFPGIVGARLWFTLFPPSALTQTCVEGQVVETCHNAAWFFQNFFNTTEGAIAVWSGGLSIFGAIIGGLLGLWLYFGPLHNPVARLFHWLFIVLPGGPIILGLLYPLFSTEARWLFAVLIGALILIWLAPYITWAFRKFIRRSETGSIIPAFESDFPAVGMRLTPWLDFAGIVLPLAQAIGRWANFVNQELYGIPTNLPWGISISEDKRVSPYTSPVDFPLPGDPAEAKFHPLFLYESLWNLIAFFVLLNLYNRNRDKFREGDFFLLYIIQYSFVRFLLEFIRAEPSIFMGINTSQAITGVAFVVALVVFVMRRNSAPKKNESMAVDNA
jgi:prolipoprotein diacylglyceryl transferase